MSGAQEKSPSIEEYWERTDLWEIVIKYLTVNQKLRLRSINQDYEAVINDCLRRDQRKLVLIHPSRFHDDDCEMKAYLKRNDISPHDAILPCSHESLARLLQFLVNLRSIAFDDVPLVALFLEALDESQVEQIQDVTVLNVKASDEQDLVKMLDIVPSATGFRMNLAHFYIAGPRAQSDSLLNVLTSRKGLQSLHLTFDTISGHGACYPFNPLNPLEAYITYQTMDDSIDMMIENLRAYSSSTLRQLCIDWPKPLDASNIRKLVTHFPLLTHLKLYVSVWPSNAHLLEEAFRSSPYQHLEHLDVRYKSWRKADVAHIHLASVLRWPWLDLSPLNDS